MKVLICGDRFWTDRETIRGWLCKLQDWGYTQVIQGGAKGADTIAKEEAKLMGFDVHTEKAEWSTYGIAAGPIRNRKMLDMMPDLVVAFHTNLSESKGTKDTVEEARRRGIMVMIVAGGVRD